VSFSIFWFENLQVWCDNKDVQDNYGTHLYDEHSPGNTRATMPLMVSQQFAETFGCKARK